MLQCSKGTAEAPEHRSSRCSLRDGRQKHLASSLCFPSQGQLKPGHTWKPTVALSIAQTSAVFALENTAIQVGFLQLEEQPRGRVATLRQGRSLHCIRISICGPSVCHLEVEATCWNVSWARDHQLLHLCHCVFVVILPHPHTGVRHIPRPTSHSPVLPGDKLLNLPQAVGFSTLLLTTQNLGL